MLMQLSIGKFDPIKLSRILFFRQKIIKTLTMHNNDTTPRHIGVGFTKNVRSTTPIQQLYNNPSHEGGSYILGPTLM
jgi:hypothetical protein